MTYQEFKNKYIGKYVDYDGSYGYQCWDLAQQYVVECLGVPEWVLSGCGNVKNMLIEPKLNDLLQYFVEVPVTEMIEGDIVIWESNHIAIEDRWDGTQNWYLTQNPSDKQPVHLQPINMWGIHAFRLKSLIPPTPEPTPEPAPVEDDLKVGDKVEIIATGNGSAHGTSNVAYGLGWTRYITAIHEGTAFPYQVGNQGLTDSQNTTGFYAKSALRKLS